MAIAALDCYNAGAISWVPALISTTYWVPVLTMRTGNRKVSTSELACTAGSYHAGDECNHLSNYSKAMSELAVIPDSSAFSRSISTIPSFLTKGERSA
jgi:hypothetical protein